MLRAQPRGRPRSRRAGHGEEALHARAAAPTTPSSSTCACPGSTASSSRACCGVRAPARAGLRVRLRVGRGRGVRAARARLPDEAGQHARAWREALARGSAAERRGERRRRTTLAGRHARRRHAAAQRARLLYLQAHGDYVRVVTADGRYLVRGTLADIERRWAPHGFLRVHRRYLVNLRRATEIRPQLNGTARADPGRRRRGADRAAPGGRVAPAAALVSAAARRARPRRGDRARRALPAPAAARAAAALAARARRVRRPGRRAAADPLPAPGAARRAAARHPAADLARRRAAVPAVRRDRPALAAPRRRARRVVPRAGRRRVTIAIVAVAAVTGAPLGIGTYGVRLARTTSDLFVASRAISRGGTPPRSRASTCARRASSASPA